MKKIRIPVGEENFELLRRKKSYYVDKTGFIEELLNEDFKVSLITRPRRFGKTLNMSMLEAFFDIRKNNREIFEDLEIMKHEGLCAEWMNQCPVLYISFKDAANDNFKDTYEQLELSLAGLCVEHAYLLDSDKADRDDKDRFARLKAGKASEAELRNSLLILTRMLYAHYGKPVVLLIDEYDVPLAKASEFGYYSKMLNVIRSIMSTSFKTNRFLQFAVVTGCLRIAKESIFTGVNNFKCNSIAGAHYLSSFGFTEMEVVQMLKDTELTTHLPYVKQWYDGYRFGNYDIYCPWDVSNYVADAFSEPEKAPGNYWKDTSHNNIIKQFVGRDSIEAGGKFETLLSGGSITAKLTEDSTYDFENAKENDFWSILYFTGYLTADRKVNCRDGETALKIPNEEIKTIFGDTIVEWFRETIAIKAAERSEMYGYKTIQCYGAAFFQKKCLIRKVTVPGSGKGSIFEIE